MSGGRSYHAPLRTHELAALRRLKGVGCRAALLTSPPDRLARLRRSLTRSLKDNTRGGTFGSISGARGARCWDARYRLHVWLLHVSLCDDSPGYMMRMCAVLLNYKRQLLAVWPQVNFSLLQACITVPQHDKSLQEAPLYYTHAFFFYITLYLPYYLKSLYDYSITFYLYRVHLHTPIAICGNWIQIRLFLLNCLSSDFPTSASLPVYAYSLGCFLKIIAC